MTICQRVLYSGRVQGVGFRYAAQRLAGGFPVNGFVRNLADGTVELVAEGTSEAIAAFLTAVARQMQPYIELERRTDYPASGLMGFHIRH